MDEKQQAIPAPVIERRHLIFNKARIPCKAVPSLPVKREPYSGITLSTTIVSKEIPNELVEEKEYVPLETLDLSIPEGEYFTVGVIVDVAGPVTAKTGKVYTTFKVASLVKYDMSKLKHLI